MVWKRLLKGLAVVLLVLVVGFSGYVIYLFAAYYRVPDVQPLHAQNNRRETLQPGQTYTAQTWNIGYGSYPPSYSFFMDGGKQSKADSKASVQKAINGVIQTTQATPPDFALFQEVDEDGDRSRHVDEVVMIQRAFADTHATVYGQNYDSPYLFYPFTDPIGKAKSGLVTLTNTHVTSARRYSLPIETTFSKFTDLDRAFTATKLPVANGKTLQLLNIHMSAFTKDQKVQAAQFKKLFDYIDAAYQTGDYVIVGGDYNHRLLKNAPAIFHTQANEYTWTHPFPFAKLPKGFTVPTAGLAEAAIPSVRYLDEPYQKGHTFVTLIDGFILSPNVTAQSVHVVDAGFKDSDHNPMRLAFSLQD